MKSFVVVCFALMVASMKFASAEDQCLVLAQDSCRPNINKHSSSSLTSTCNARFGAIDSLESELVRYAHSHIIRSFEYLLMSTHFANYDMNRLGFEKLFRGFSDSKWNNAIELIKHISKRGGKMNFQNQAHSGAQSDNYELAELESLAKALDIEKSLMNEAYNIHDRSIKKIQASHDPEISHYLEEEFIESGAGTIRDLSGHVSDLSKLLSDTDSQLSLYLFDDYLKNL